MDKREYHIGPGAASLILIIVVLCMSTLGMLALYSARSDERLTVREAAVAEEVYDLYECAERSLSALDTIIVESRKGSNPEGFLTSIKESLPDYMTLAGNTVSWVECNKDERRLICSVEISTFDDTQSRYRWVEHRIGSEFSEMEIEDTWS